LLVGLKTCQIIKERKQAKGASGFGLPGGFGLLLAASDEQEIKKNHDDDLQFFNLLSSKQSHKLWLKVY
jgi:hypothetical protein